MNDRVIRAHFILFQRPPTAKELAMAARFLTGREADKKAWSEYAQALLASNEARIAGDGSRILNMIHRDDVTGAIIAALKNARAGEIYNAVDDEPVAQIHFFRWLSEAENAERKRGLTNKKVQNRKLKMELGCPFKRPNFRLGYTAEMIRLEKEGKMDFGPEPR